MNPCLPLIQGMPTCSANPSTSIIPEERCFQEGLFRLPDSAAAFRPWSVLFTDCRPALVCLVYRSEVVADVAGRERSIGRHAVPERKRLREV